MTVNGAAAPQAPAARQPTRDTVVSRAYSGLVDVTKAQQKHNDKVRANAKHLNQEGLRAQLASFADSDEAKSVAGIEASVDQLVAQKQAEVDASLKALSPVGDTAEELRNDRAWGRTERKLAAAKDIGKVTQTARQALEQANPAELGVLLQQIPSYLESVGAPTNWINDVVAHKVPELAEKRDTLATAKQAQAMNRTAAKLVLDGIRDGSPPTQLHRLDPSRFDPDRDPGV
jgi:spore coat protein CotF